MGLQSGTKFPSLTASTSLNLLPRLVKHILILLLSYLPQLKSIGFKLQVQLTAEKEVNFSQAQPIENWDLTDQKLQKLDSAEVLNKAQARKNV